jgi:hypothetical protein
MVAHAYKTRTWKAEAEGLRVQGQTGLHSETLSQKKVKNKILIDFFNLNKINVLVYH